MISGCGAREHRRPAGLAFSWPERFPAAAPGNAGVPPALRSAGRNDSRTDGFRTRPSADEHGRRECAHPRPGAAPVPISPSQTECSIVLASHVPLRGARLELLVRAARDRHLAAAIDPAGEAPAAGLRGAHPFAAMVATAPQ